MYSLLDGFGRSKLPADLAPTTTGAVSDSLFGGYLIPFEVVSMLLLAALVGAAEAEAPGAVVADLKIARGLDYYTGLVYETVLDAHPQIGSICSGGRYDNLASHYTKSKLPGVGISIGLTRLFWQLREAGLIATADSSVDVLVTLLDDADLDHALALSQQLRASGLNVETQLEPRKLAKQLQYADRAGIRFVVIRGGDEAAKGVVAVKDLRRGEQFEVADAELARTLRIEREQSRVAGSP